MGKEGSGMRPLKHVCMMMGTQYTTSISAGQQYLRLEPVHKSLEGRHMGVQLNLTWAVKDQVVLLTISLQAADLIRGMHPTLHGLICLKAELIMQADLRDLIGPVKGLHHGAGTLLAEVLTASSSPIQSSRFSSRYSMQYSSPLHDR